MTDYIISAETIDKIVSDKEVPIRIVEQLTKLKPLSEKGEDMSDIKIEPLSDKEYDQMTKYRADTNENVKIMVIRIADVSIVLEGVDRTMGDIDRIMKSQRIPEFVKQKIAEGKLKYKTYHMGCRCGGHHYH
jgi:hypothetical protein